MVSSAYQMCMYAHERLQWKQSWQDKAAKLWWPMLATPTDI